MDGIWSLTEFIEGNKYYIKLNQKAPWDSVKLIRGVIDKARWTPLISFVDLQRYQSVKRFVESKIISREGTIVTLVDSEDPESVEIVLPELPKVKRKEKARLKYMLKEELRELALEEGFEYDSIKILKKDEIITLLKEKGYE